MRKIEIPYQWKCRIDQSENSEFVYSLWDIWNPVKCFCSWYYRLPTGTAYCGLARWFLKKCANRQMNTTNSATNSEIRSMKYGSIKRSFEVSIFRVDDTGHKNSASVTMKAKINIGAVTDLKILSLSVDLILVLCSFFQFQKVKKNLYFFFLYNCQLRITHCIGHRTKN